MVVAKPHLWLYTGMEKASDGDWKMNINRRTATTDVMSNYWGTVCRSGARISEGGLGVE